MKVFRRFDAREKRSDTFMGSTHQRLRPLYVATSIAGLKPDVVVTRL
jgi:hypothetical protein